MASRVLRLTETIRKTGLPKSSIYQKVAEGTFPRPIKLGPGARASGWIEDELDTWISQQKSRARRA